MFTEDGPESLTVNSLHNPPECLHVRPWIAISTELLFITRGKSRVTENTICKFVFIMNRESER